MEEETKVNLGTFFGFIGFIFLCMANVFVALLVLFAVLAYNIGKSRQQSLSAKKAEEVRRRRDYDES